MRAGPSAPTPAFVASAIFRLHWCVSYRQGALTLDKFGMGRSAVKDYAKHDELKSSAM